MMKGGSFLVLFCVLIFSAEIAVAEQINPPEPYAYTEGPKTVPCAEGNDSTEKDGVSPPPGLCLPINDYLVPLFAAGLCLGGYSLFRLEMKKAGL